MLVSTPPLSTNPLDNEIYFSETNEHIAIANLTTGELVDVVFQFSEKIKSLEAQLTNFGVQLHEEFDNEEEDYSVEEMLDFWKEQLESNKK